eukprot:485270-Rhodomonas_salina.1
MREPEPKGRSLREGPQCHWQWHHGAKAWRSTVFKLLVPSGSANGLRVSASVNGSSHGAQAQAH